MAKQRLTDQQIQDIANFLRGSAYPIDEGFEKFGLRYEDADDSSLQTLDTLIFDCDSCNHWYDVEDLGEGGVCYFCHDSLQEQLNDEAFEDFPVDEEDDDLES